MTAADEVMRTFALKWLQKDRSARWEMEDGRD
jgi:hypothetical protein